jgi:hypothetical protein
MDVREGFRPQPMGADSSITVAGTGISGFLPVTAGTISVVDADGTTVLNAYPLSAGVFSKIPIYFNFAGNKTITLGGGASGTLLI